VPFIMSYEAWLSQTEISRTIRSRRLRKVDNALKAYHKTKSKADKDKLKLALHHWKMELGYDAAAGKPAWMTHPRNGKHAVERLDMQLFAQPTELVTPVLADLAELPFFGMEAWVDDYRAKQALKEARRDALVKMFAGKRVEFPRAKLSWEMFSVKRHVAGVESRANQFASTAAAAAEAPAIAEAQQIVEGLIDGILGPFPLEVAREVMSFVTSLVPQFALEVAQSIVPYVSLGVSFGLAVKNTGQTIHREYQWVQAGKHMPAFGGDNAEAAALSVRRMIERVRNHHAELAAIYGADATAKTVSDFSVGARPLREIQGEQTARRSQESPPDNRPFRHLPCAGLLLCGVLEYQRSGEFHCGGYRRARLAIRRGNNGEESYRADDRVCEGRDFHIAA
jgi:hypothetical protein